MDFTDFIESCVHPWTSRFEGKGLCGVGMPGLAAPGREQDVGWGQPHL